MEIHVNRQQHSFRTRGMEADANKGTLSTIRLPHNLS